MEQNINRDIANIYKNQKFCDITFNVEGTLFQLHKTILAARCTYFENLLFLDMKEANMKVIDHNVSKMSFERVMDFIYIGICNISLMKEDEIIELISLAHYYQYEELLTTILSKIKITNQTPGSFVSSIINLDFIDELVDLKESCLKFIDENSTLLVKTLDSTLSEKVQLLSDILSRNTFCVDEIEIFKCINRWVQKNGEDKNVINCLRLNLISEEDFVDIIVPSKLYDCLDYIKAKKEKKFSRRIKFNFCEHKGRYCKGVLLRKIIKYKNTTNDDVVWTEISFEMKEMLCKFNSLLLKADSGKVHEDYLDIRIFLKDNEDKITTYNSFISDYACRFDFSLQTVKKVIVQTTNEDIPEINLTYIKQLEFPFVSLKNTKPISFVNVIKNLN